MITNSKCSHGGSRLPGGAGSYQLQSLRGDHFRLGVAPAIPPYTMILLAEEALEAERFDEAARLIEAVYSLYD